MLWPSASQVRGSISRFWALRVDFEHLGIILDLWEAILEDNFELLGVDFGPLGVDFRFSLSI